MQQISDGQLTDDEIEIKSSIETLKLILDGLMLLGLTLLVTGLIKIEKLISMSSGATTKK